MQSSTTLDNTQHKTNVLNSDKPAIYVACLASYNNGYLHGHWIDATLGMDEVHDAIQAMLKASPEAFAEEFAIHDFQNFAGIRLDEYESIEDVCKIAEKLEEHGEIFGEIYAHCSDFDEALEMMEDRYCGCYKSRDDCIYQYVDDIGMLQGVDESIKRYFDYDALLHDMECSGDINVFELGYNEIHVFYSH